MRRSRGSKAAVLTAAVMSTAAAHAEGVLWATSLTIDNAFTLFTIDPATGAQTEVGVVAVPEGRSVGTIAWSPALDAFVGTSRAIGASASDGLAIIDPVNLTLEDHLLTDVPKSIGAVSGVAVDPTTGQIVITVGPGGTLEDRLMEVTSTGAFVQLSANLGLGDRDVIDYSAASGGYVACDFNGPGGPTPRVAQLIDPFGSPAFIALQNPPNDGNRGDIAIDPRTDALYVVGFGPEAGQIVRVEDDSYIPLPEVGVQLAGLAFVSASVPCDEDLDDDGVVGASDLAILLAAWGVCDPPCEPDFDGSGDVGAADLATLLAAWGEC